jgi:hypothetical protein
MSSDRIFSTTGKPIATAALTAAAGLARTRRVGTTLMWHASSTALASGSVSISRPAASALSTIALMAAVSGRKSACKADGASLSSAWLRR